MKDLNKMTFSELQSHIEELSKKKDTIGKSKVLGTPYIVGTDYLIRTITMIYTGTLEQVHEHELVITNAAWIPETERWASTVEFGKFKEVEPYPADAKVIIGRQTILDMTPTRWKLPREQK